MTYLDRIEIKRADITRLKVDAVVNAANEQMLGGGGVDGAIHRAAGPELRQACLEVPQVRPGVRCPTGEARLTGGHRLARFVIHTVGPVWQGGEHGEADLLASCYRNSLTLAIENGVRTMAFPAISCGVFGYPIPEACRIAIRELASFLKSDGSLEQVVFAAFDAKVQSALEEALQSLQA